MIQRDRHLKICMALIAANLCFIWGNSLLPAEASQALSDWVKSFLHGMFTSEEPAEAGSGLLRKIAHFAEFTSLGLLLSHLLTQLGKKHRYALPLGFLAACIDETIQVFVPGRGPGLLDVAIDTCGVLTGMILLRLGYALWKQKQPKQYGGKSI